MGYKTTTNKEFKGKGLIDLNEGVLISTDKKDSGESYSIAEILTKIAGEGDEIELSVKKKEVIDDVDGE